MTQHEVKRPSKIVEVTWVDAQTVDRGGWCDVSDVLNKKHGAPSVSVGFLLHRDEKVISIGASLSLDQDEELVEQVSGSMIIPMEMVKRVRVLK